MKNIVKVFLGAIVIMSLSILETFAFNNTKIKIIVDGKEVSAILNDSKASKDLISRLPLEFTMNDLYGREKYINLSKSLTEESKKQSKYDVGDIAFWYPWKSLVIFYKQDSDTIPQGIFVLGKIEDGIEIFDNNRNSIKVKIELVKN